MPAPVAPPLDTERLTLRGHTVEDFAESAAMWGDPEVTRFIGGRPFSAEEVWSRLLRYAGHWALKGYGYWVVRERGSGRFVGEVGFADFRRAIEPPLGEAPEAGWVLSPWAHSKGFGSEAVRALHAWGDKAFGGARTVCLIAPENAPSLALAARVGYREYARSTYHDAPTILLERGPQASFTAS
ncbi:MAG: GNAT family N-acetyltransferase [Phenylobacterium sp.]|uniref:GNAT family N-acetyltransferase n=1 Tax=Phenylobacterium sp. TaxID=1871053 RepID=UPI00391D246A